MLKLINIKTYKFKFIKINLKNRYNNKFIIQQNYFFYNILNVEAVLHIVIMHFFNEKKKKYNFIIY